MSGPWRVANAATSFAESWAASWVTHSTVTSGSLLASSWWNSVMTGFQAARLSYQMTTLPLGPAASAGPAPTAPSASDPSRTAASNERSDLMGCPPTAGPERTAGEARQPHTLAQRVGGLPAPAARSRQVEHQHLGGFPSQEIQPELAAGGPPVTLPQHGPVHRDRSARDVDPGMTRGAQREVPGFPGADDSGPEIHVLVDVEATV